MARMNFKNTFGAIGDAGGTDLQRVDLFKVTIDLPSAIAIDWTEQVEFAVAKFPFPERAVEMIPVKYFQQTNHLIGGDVPTPPVDIPVRYAFNARTIEALEKWMTLIRNARTGGVGQTSLVKTKGLFRWFVPNQVRQNADLTGQPTTSQTTLKDGLQYHLEGCLIKGLRLTDADHTVGNATVEATFSLQIDRYYPENIDKMQILP